MSAVPLDVPYELVVESVASEVIENEVIIVHFDSGNYFSLRGAAFRAWGLLIDNAVVPSSLIPLIDADEAAAIQQMERFIEVLTSEMIIQASTSTPNGDFTCESLPLAELVVEKYEDMQLLLLGDPIHEVEEAGWPAMREGGDQ